MGRDEVETMHVELFKKLVYKRKDESRTLSKSLEQEVVNDSLQAGSRPGFKKVKFYLNTV